MEITISSASSSSCCLTLNSLRRIVWPQHRSSSKQSLPIIPPFMIVSKLNELQPVHPRRLAQYHPSIWDLKLIESLSTLSNPYTYELYGTRLEVLKRSAKCLLTSTKDPCAQLNLVCTMQWLGVAYHFEKEIEEVLALLYPHLTTNSLHTTALQFRVLRQHGFSITSDVFDKFRSSDGRFMDSLSSDMEGLLSLYEASHLAMHGENILEEGKDFSIRNLKSLMGKLDSDSAKQVKQSLEIPLYWRMPRVEARSFIDVYQRDMAKNLTLLELAKLDNNLVQYVYQQELIELARWKMEAMEDLPEYMRICYLAMLNFANEVVFDVLKDHGFNIFPYIKEAWENLCRSYLVERRWFSSGYTPTLDEYLENAWISVGGPSAIVHAYVLLGCTISKDALDCLKRGPELIYWASLITRLSDDLGTWEAESKRGDVVKSIECYMVQEGVSKEEAQDHIKRLISSSWKKLNEESAKSSLPKSVVKMSLNMARTAQCIYQHGDGIGISTGVIKDHLTSLIVKPIPIE
ncbi:probable terpene synthase 9 isoform X2 [Corylus avellana]|uniref:probable terpene synthase 9 isoform X2 n=1 Tax=Corylus avellana TaxID=13451 RepID=UPI00286CC2C9|nr:probable terpene synthase 9 isoform X2 [Corylus avellana]